MGLGIVLLFGAVGGFVVAGIGAAVGGHLTARLTRGVSLGRRRVMLSAYLWPFVCLCWGGVVFAFQAVVNEGLFHRDLGIGDTLHVALPNGYQLLMIDVTDQGWVYNPATRSSSGVTEREDSVPGVRSLAVAGRYIVGAADSRFFERFGTDSDEVDSYFILDTQSGTRMRFEGFSALRVKARALGIEPKLQPIQDVYSRFRFTWFDIITAALFLLPPAAGGLLLVVWICRLRRSLRVPT